MFNFPALKDSTLAPAGIPMFARRSNSQQLITMHQIPIYFTRLHSLRPAAPNAATIHRRRGAAALSASTMEGVRLRHDRATLYGDLNQNAVDMYFCGGVGTLKFEL